MPPSAREYILQQREIDAQMAQAIQQQQQEQQQEQQEQEEEEEQEEQGFLKITVTNADKERAKQRYDTQRDGWMV